MDVGVFTFEEFAQRLRQYNAIHDEPRGSANLMRWGFVLLVSGTVLGYVGIELFHGRLELAVAAFGLMVELSGAAVLGYQFYRYDLPQFRHPLRDDACLLDRMFREGEPLLEWLCSFPADELERAWRFVRNSNHIMTRRMNWMFGPIERLGPLPLLVALYLQLKNVTWQWPPKIDLMHGWLVLLLLFLYVLGAFIVIQRMRRQSYEAWLGEAVTRNRAAFAPTCSSDGAAMREAS